MKIPFFLSLCAFALAVTACTAPQGKKVDGVAAGPDMAPAKKTIALDENSDGQIVSVKKGGTVTVTLRASHDTGFQWKLAEVPDATVLQMISDDFLPPVAEGPVAAAPLPGSDLITFKAVGTGVVPIKLWYAGPWQAGATRQKCYVTVQVE